MSALSHRKITRHVKITSTVRCHRHRHLTVEGCFLALQVVEWPMTSHITISSCGWKRTMSMTSAAWKGCPSCRTSLNSWLVGRQPRNPWPTLGCSSAGRDEGADATKDPQWRRAQLWPHTCSNERVHRAIVYLTVDQVEDWSCRRCSLLSATNFFFFFDWLSAAVGQGEWREGRK